MENKKEKRLANEITEIGRAREGLPAFATVTRQLNHSLVSHVVALATALDLTPTAAQLSDPS